MDENLIVGVELLDYMSELTDVAAQVLNALEVLSGMSERVEGAYKGEATESIVNYFKQLYEHISRLCEFYAKGASYVYHTYESMYQSDAAMAAWLMGQEGIQVTGE